MSDRKTDEINEDIDRLLESIDRMLVDHEKIVSKVDDMIDTIPKMIDAYENNYGYKEEDCKIVYFLGIPILKIK